MLVGRNATIYRTISNVSIEELSKLIDIKIIEQIENDACIISDTKISGEGDTKNSITSDTVSKYYATINMIKQNKSIRQNDGLKADNRLSLDESAEGQNDPLPNENADGQNDHKQNLITDNEVKSKTRKTRQPKTKS